MRRDQQMWPAFFIPLWLLAGSSLSWGAGESAGSTPAKPSTLTSKASTDVGAGVTLCHVPPGRAANARALVVAQSAAAEHLAHGDYLGECHTLGASFPSEVPKTGQTGCWDELGTPINCAGTGQDGELQKGVSASPRFTDNGDGTATDNLSGLIWLKNATCFGKLSWADALLAANGLESGSCGLTDGSVAGDWRLPNINELQSLIDSGYVDAPFSFIPGIAWSSTTYETDPAGAWAAVLPWGGLFGYYKVNNPNAVWAVRGGQ